MDELNRDYPSSIGRALSATCSSRCQNPLPGKLPAIPSLRRLWDAADRERLGGAKAASRSSDDSAHRSSTHPALPRAIWNRSVIFPAPRTHRRARDWTGVERLLPVLPEEGVETWRAFAWLC